jgi:hypothetical protein
MTSFDVKEPNWPAVAIELHRRRTRVLVPVALEADRNGYVRFQRTPKFVFDRLRRRHGRPSFLAFLNTPSVGVFRCRCLTPTLEEVFDVRGIAYTKSPQKGAAMAKGIIGNAAEAAAAVAKTALGAAATAAATVVIHNVARSIAKKSGKPIPPPTSDKPMPEIEVAVQQLLAPAPKDRKRPRAAASKKTKPAKKPGAATKNVRAAKTRKVTPARKAVIRSRKKR